MRFQTRKGSECRAEAGTEYKRKNLVMCEEQLAIYGLRCRMWAMDFQYGLEVCPSTLTWLPWQHPRRKTYPRRISHPLQVEALPRAQLHHGEEQQHRLHPLHRRQRQRLALQQQKHQLKRPYFH